MPLERVTHPVTPSVATALPSAPSVIVVVLTIAVASVWSPLYAPQRRAPMPRNDRVINDAPEPGELVDVRGRWVVYIVNILGVIFVEVEVNNESVA